MAIVSLLTMAWDGLTTTNKPAPAGRPHRPVVRIGQSLASTVAGQRSVLARRSAGWPSTSTRCLSGLQVSLAEHLDRALDCWRVVSACGGRAPRPSASQCASRSAPCGRWLASRVHLQIAVCVFCQCMLADVDQSRVRQNWCPFQTASIQLRVVVRDTEFQ